MVYSPTDLTRHPAPVDAEAAVAWAVDFEPIFAEDDDSWYPCDAHDL